MLRKLALSLLLTACALPATAQNWSVGIRTGPFVFGDFLERKLLPISGDSGGEPITLTLSAATRAGLSVDIERSFAPRWAMRLEGTFTRAPLSVKDTSDDGTVVKAGEVDVTTFMLPIVFRINPNGSFRFHIVAGPAHAIYRFEGPASNGNIRVSDETRSEWGAAAGLGVLWLIRDRIGIEAEISDIVTTSPFDESDLPDAPGFRLPKPHNVHTTIGIRYRF